MAGRSNLSIVTLNVRGIATAFKRAKIFHFLPLLKADIYLLQETNISGHSLKQRRNGLAYPFGRQVILKSEVV